MDKETYDVGEGEIRNEMILASKLYIDLEFVKYIDIGKYLASSEMTKNRYRDVLSFLEDDTFEERYTDKVDHTISSIPASTNHDKVLLASPFLSSETDIVEFITAIRQNKKILEEDSTITIDLNVNGLSEMSSNMIGCIEKVYSKIFGVNVTVINKAINAYSVDTLLKYDAMFIYQLDRFNNTFIKELDERKFFEKYIFTRKTLPDIMLNDLEGVNVSEFFVTVFSVMSTACRFSYIENPTCSITPINRGNRDG